MKFKPGDIVTLKMTISQAPVTIIFQIIAIENSTFDVMVLYTNETECPYPTLKLLTWVWDGFDQDPRCSLFTPTRGHHSTDSKPQNS